MATKTSSVARKANRAKSFANGQERKAFRIATQEDAAARNKKNPAEAPWAKAQLARVMRRLPLQGTGD